MCNKAIITINISFPDSPNLFSNCLFCSRPKATRFRAEIIYYTLITAYYNPETSYYSLIITDFRVKITCNSLEITYFILKITDFFPGLNGFRLVFKSDYIGLTERR